MARVPVVARRRFFSGTPLGTFAKLLYFSLKTSEDQKKVFTSVELPFSC